MRAPGYLDRGENEMSFKERIQRAIPIWRQMLERPTPFVRQAPIDGSTAGIFTVADIKKGDQLVSVIEVTTTTAALVDRTAEFVLNTDEGQLIRVDAEIDNTGGTDTSGDALIVTWLAWAE